MPRKVAYVLLMLCLIVLAFVGGSYIQKEYHIFKEKEQENSSPSGTTEEVLPIDHEDVQAVYRNIVLVAPYQVHYNALEKGSLTNQEKLQYAYYTLLQEENRPHITTNGEVGEIKETDLKAVYERLFGLSDYQADNFALDPCPSFHYVKDSEVYRAENFLACGGIGDPTDAKHVLLSAVRKGNQLVVTEMVGFTSPDPTGATSNWNLYSDVRRTNQIASRSETDFDFDLLEHRTKLPHYRYTFTKENGHYIFTKGEKIAS